MTESVSDVSDLEVAIRASWSRETAYNPGGWKPDRPSLGQCAVTALVLQDSLGGELLRAKVGDDTHYWLKLSCGCEIDLTREQFDHYDPVEIETVTRDYVLSYPATVTRYQLLKDRVQTYGGHEVNAS